jgi:hypothetical protein
MKFAGLLSVLALVTACAPHSEQAETAVPPIQQELQAEQPFQLGAGSRVVIGVSGEWIENGEGQAELPILDGELTLRAAESKIEIVDLALAFDDVELSALAPVGSKLTDLRIDLGGAPLVDGQWSDAEASAHGALDVVFSWSLGLSSGSSPLSEQTIDDLPFDVTVTSEDGALSAELGIAHEGAIWNLDRYIEVTSVAIELHGMQR